MQEKTEAHFYAALTKKEMFKTFSVCGRDKTILFIVA